MLNTRVNAYMRPYALAVGGLYPVEGEEGVNETCKHALLSQKQPKFTVLGAPHAANSSSLCYLHEIYRRFHEGWVLDNK